MDHFLYIKNYLITDCIEFVPLSSDFPLKEMFLYRSKTLILNSDAMYIPIQDASHIITDVPIMEAKFKLAGTISCGWEKYFNFKRNETREKELYHDVCRLSDNEKFNFLNLNYASPPNILRYSNKICFKEDLKIIEMQVIDGYNLFDWCKVFEKAQEIQTIATSICFIIDKMATTNNITMYRRPEQNEYNYINEKKIYTREWNRVI
jgi:hypothetical protein